MCVCEQVCVHMKSPVPEDLTGEMSLVPTLLLRGRCQTMKKVVVCPISHLWTTLQRHQNGPCWVAPVEGLTLRRPDGIYTKSKKDISGC